MINSQKLDGKTALVTGAASGIGNAIAHTLQSQGCHVISVDLKQNTDKDLVGEKIVADLTVKSDLQQLIQSVSQIDFLVNAAGISITREIEQTSEDDWNRVLDVNAKVPFQLMQAFGPRMASGGAIVNIASVSGKMATNILGAPYNASKAALLALTKTFAYALADKNVRVNAICPGVTETPMLDGIWEEDSKLSGIAVEQLIKQYLTRVPLKRLGVPQEIADATAFLLSDEARYITGQSLNVCGGLVMS